MENPRGSGVPFPPDFEGFLESMSVVEAEQKRDRSDWRQICHIGLVSANYLYC